jgi:hypothetical protein
VYPKASVQPASSPLQKQFSCGFGSLIVQQQPLRQKDVSFMKKWIKIAHINLPARVPKDNTLP